jgi:hypothetical protein
MILPTACDWECELVVVRLCVPELVVFGSVLQWIAPFVSKNIYTFPHKTELPIVSHRQGSFQAAESTPCLTDSVCHFVSSDFKLRHKQVPFGVHSYLPLLKNLLSSTRFDLMFCLFQFDTQHKEFLNRFPLGKSSLWNPSSQYFIFQFCDVAEVAIVHNTIQPDLAIKFYESKNKKRPSFNIFAYQLELKIASDDFLILEKKSK